MELQSSLAPASSAGSQYRHQAEQYSRALRLLNRQARQGNADAAIGAIKVSDHAVKMGFAPGGVRNANEYRADANNYGRVLEAGARKREADINRLAQDPQQQRIGNPQPLGQRPQEQRIGNPQPLGGPEQMGPPTPTRMQSTLGVLEARNHISDGGPKNFEQLTSSIDELDRAEAGARALGVQGVGALSQGDTALKYRQTLDQALGQAESPEEIQGLRDRGLASGIDEGAFDRRAQYWDEQRKRQQGLANPRVERGLASQSRFPLNQGQNRRPLGA